MSDEGVLRAIMEILKQRGHIGLSDVLEIAGIAGDIQARRCLDKGVQRGLLARAQGGGYILPIPREALHDQEVSRAE